ncbi:MAG: FHA domain-containing protein [Blastochloris sp.]|nr:FHA domain-containing protein [Blastochloris sp.]
MIYQHPDGAEERFRLDNDVTTIGRSDTCTVCISLPTVSRLHATVELQHDRYVLLDAGSANGTFVGAYGSRGCNDSAPAMRFGLDRKSYYSSSTRKKPRQLRSASTLNHC